MALPAKKVRKTTKATVVRKNNKKAGLMSRRRKKNSVRVGMQLGELYVMQRVATKQGSSGGQRWRVECSCGKRLTVPQWYLVRKEFPKRHCGCKVKESTNPNPRERGIFYMMHRRCYNSTHVAFKHYGGANPPITVCDTWNKDVVGNEKAWQSFIKDMGPAPTKGHTLDRIDPYKGYGWQPRDGTGELYLNCRWATASEQMNNLKKHWLSPAERAAKAEAEKFDIYDEEADDDDTDDSEESHD